MTRKRRQARGYFWIVQDQWELRANAAAWGIGSAGGSVSSERTYAVYRAYEITHCKILRDNAIVRAPPKGARWYPASVCFGRQFDAVFSAASNAVTADLEASFAIYSGNLSSFAKQNNLKFEYTSAGYDRKKTCDRFLFDTPASFEKCFAALPRSSTPVLVKWRELPGATKARKKRERRQAKSGRTQKDMPACMGTGPKCAPCALWEFSKASYSPPKGGLEIRITISGPDSGRQTHNGAMVMLGENPILARPGDEVEYLVEDEDLIFDDTLATGKIRIQRRHAGGRVADGRFTLSGRCAER